MNMHYFFSEKQGYGVNQIRPRKVEFVAFTNNFKNLHKRLIGDITIIICAAPSEKIEAKVNIYKLRIKTYVI